LHGNLQAEDQISRCGFYRNSSHNYFKQEDIGKWLEMQSQKRQDDLAGFEKTVRIVSSAL